MFSARRNDQEQLHVMPWEEKGQNYSRLLLGLMIPMHVNQRDAL